MAANYETFDFEGREALLMQGDELRTGNRVGSYTFSYLLGASLIAALIWYSGTWLFLGNTRLLDVLINSGVIAYTDSQAGFIKGIPDLKLYLKSQDLIKWGLVDTAALILILYFLTRAAQFHSIARYCGIEGSYIQHARIYLEGVGINRLLPFNRGNVTTASMFAVLGVPAERTSFALYLQSIFRVFEITVFALVGLFAVGWGAWLGQVFWALVILGVCYFFVRSSGRHRTPPLVIGTTGDAGQAVRALLRSPWTLIKLCVLSLICFSIQVVTAYMIAMAFTSTYVILNVEFSVLLMGVVAANIAQLIPLTPGGLGLYEWGFATALYSGGVGLPECVAIAVLNSLVRFVDVMIILATVVMLRLDYSFEGLKRVQRLRSRRNGASGG